MPIDDVYLSSNYRWRVHTFEEAIQFHRETNHPTMCNVPNAPVVAQIELNMQGEKATRFVEGFSRMATIQHKFDHGEERSIIVFTKDMENLEIAKAAGATAFGGPDLIKKIQNGDVSMHDFEFALAHPNILPELVSIRGLMRKKFPNVKLGTLGPDLKGMIEKFQNGIKYKAVRDMNQQNYGEISTAIGSLDMDVKHLEENLVSILKDVDSMRPKRTGKFITSVLIKCAPSEELFKIDPFVYISEERAPDSGKKKKDEEMEASEAEETETQAAAAAN